MLDGEEVIGAKQNRVLNTSILVPAGAELVIPVSCTEQGRWRYASAAFSSSDAFLAHKIRSSKARSVSRSLESSAQYHSDQGEVWGHIHALHEKAHFMSPTHAMADVFKAREEDLHRCLESFPLLPGQNGLVVLIDGQVAGLDTLSRPQAYARLHPKLVRSYAIDALLDPDRPSSSASADATTPQTANRQPSSIPAGGTSEGRPPTDPLAQTKAFFAELEICEFKPFPSVGCGQDCRLTGPRLVGAALVHDQKIIHAALFRTDPADQGSSLASLRRRRGFAAE